MGTLDGPGRGTAPLLTPAPEVETGQGGQGEYGSGRHPPAQGSALRVTPSLPLLPWPLPLYSAKLYRTPAVGHPTASPAQGQGV